MYCCQRFCFRYQTAWRFKRALGYINPLAPAATFSSQPGLGCLKETTRTNIPLAVSKLDNLGRKHPSLSIRAVNATEMHHRSAAECLEWGQKRKYWISIFSPLGVAQKIRLPSIEMKKLHLNWVFQGAKIRSDWYNVRARFYFHLFIAHTQKTTFRVLFLNFYISPLTRYRFRFISIFRIIIKTHVLPSPVFYHSWEMMFTAIGR